MSTRRVPTTQSYDLFKAAVTVILLFMLLLAVAFNSRSTQAAESETELAPTLDPVVDLPPTISESVVVAGCIELSGIGIAGVETQIRAGDERILGSVIVGEDSTWSLTACVNPGNFRLVAVSVNEAGTEINRSTGLVVLVPDPTAVPTLVPVATEPTPVATSVSMEGQDYIVKLGDWLMGIARDVYGDASRAEDIFNATNAKSAGDPSYATISDPNTLEVGWKIWIPLP